MRGFFLLLSLHAPDGLVQRPEQRRNARGQPGRSALADVDVVEWLKIDVRLLVVVADDGPQIDLEHFRRLAVGDMSATLKPLSNAIKAAQAATAVLPEPTSPWSRRRIGCAPPMSARISRSTRVCAVVSLKPSWARNGLIR